MRKKNIIRIVLLTALILLIPLLAMQFTDEVAWDLADFVAAGTLLLGAGLTYEFIAGRTSSAAYRAAVAIAVLGVLLLFWVNGAVGIIGSENQSVNLMYGAVFVVIFTGSLISRFKSRGMAHTLFAAALLQMLVPVIALIIWPPPAISWTPSVFGVFILSASFAALFAVSALLFRRASFS